MKYSYKPTPFNLDILVLNKQQLRMMSPTTSLSIFDSSSGNFAKDGLFSTEIYGVVGSEDRNSKFSYIDIGVSVLHPLIYKHVITTRSLYKDVMEGKKYAVYSNKLKDLVLSDENDGETGYSFFMSVLEKLNLSDRDSDQRKFKLYMLSKYGTPEYMLKQVLVIPAGLRDYKINASGRPEEDEINDMYRKVLTLSNSLGNIKITDNTIGAVDVVRFRIQESLLELYEHIMRLLDGKRKFIQGKWGTRGVMFATRNVITPSLAGIGNLNDTNVLDMEHTTVGLYQYAAAITPVTMNKLHTTFVYRIFNPDNNKAYLIDPKKKSSVLVSVDTKDRDKWITLEGLEGIINLLSKEDIRSAPVMVGDYYMLLVHDDGKNITPVFNTDEMPEDMDAKYLRPITYYELFYIALLDTYSKYRCLVTRYPVINLGGIYPSKIYVKTTGSARKVNVILDGISKEANEYPNYKEAYYNSLSPHHVYLQALGGDYDGCTYVISCHL